VNWRTLLGQDTTYDREHSVSPLHKAGALEILVIYTIVSL